MCVRATEGNKLAKELFLFLLTIPWSPLALIAIMCLRETAERQEGRGLGWPHYKFLGDFTQSVWQQPEGPRPAGCSSSPHPAGHTNQIRLRLELIIWARALPEQPLRQVGMTSRLVSLLPSLVSADGVCRVNTPSENNSYWVQRVSSHFSKTKLISPPR